MPGIELAALRRAQLDSKIRPGCRLTYGALRRRSLLTWPSGQPADDLATGCADCAQYLTYHRISVVLSSHIPAHAAVNEAVNLVRRMGEGRAQGFVNAVARRVRRQTDIPPDTFLI